MSQKYTIARLTLGKERFEILVKPDPALRYKQGEGIGLSQILLIDEIYTDAGKGTRASSDNIEKFFGTQDVSKIAEKILRDGELLITAEQRRRLIEEKKKQIISFISRNCIDPRTNAPLPPLRIEQAIDKVKPLIDPFKPAEEQAKSIIDTIRREIPIKMENIKVAVKILPQYAAKAYGAAKNFGQITKEEWLRDGSWTALIEMPAGVYGSFIDKLGRITQGTIQVKQL
ncbi:MAG: ribosome assembly factor SBDS [Candidatus Bathyarchaeia archaeon]